MVHGFDRVAEVVYLLLCSYIQTLRDINSLVVSD